MNNQELLDLLTLQSNITTSIIALTALILVGILFDISLHLYIKYFKKEKKK